MRNGVEELIQVQGDYYILASSSRVDDRTRVLKHGDTFAVLDRFGDIATVGLGELGLYRDGTRFVSRFALTIDGRRPLLLGSTVTADNARLVVDLTNPDITSNLHPSIPRGTLHLNREILLWHGVAYERIRIVNHGDSGALTTLGLEIDADFHDIFEVRGMHRTRSGERFEPVAGPHGMELRYLGLDGVRRTLEVLTSPAPKTSGRKLLFDLGLEPREERTIYVTCRCRIGDQPTPLIEWTEAANGLEGTFEESRREDCVIRSSSDLFDDWVQRSIADLHMMVTDTRWGPYPYAGAPWYSVPFGRDGLITALQLLWVNPSFARGVLSFLAAHQADTTDDAKDAQPGKILHEAREGEMAALGEVPFGRYYGSVDSTPLFVMLAGAYYRRTGDRAFIETLWPHVERALQWMETSGDVDGDGFIEYARTSPHGLVQQGWKDSFDSVFHAAGHLADPPIALCEVQGYAFGAYKAAALLSRCLGRDDARKWVHRAARLRERFDRAFWCEDIGTYALALDGRKQQCRVRTSNAGHALFTGIAKRERAMPVLEALLREESFSGYGIRTVASNEARYNPMSYHNGSVWPHDNAMIALGFSHYGLGAGTLQVMNAIFDGSTFVELHRLPELYCGFRRRLGAGPTLYPVACSPQSWAAGAVFMLLQACLGLTLDGVRGRILFRSAVLPEWMESLELRGLRVGDAAADLRIVRHNDDVGITVLRREGRVDVVSLR
jgi:glycogen debranching enzyme